MTNDKTNVSAYVEQDVADYLGQDHVNASGLINQLVKKHMNGESEEVLREFRRKQLLEEAQDFESRAERKRKEAEKLAEVNEEREEQREDEIEERIDEIAGDVPRDPENAAVRHNAEQLGISPEELVERLPENDGEGGLSSL